LSKAEKGKEKRQKKGAKKRGKKKGQRNKENKKNLRNERKICGSSEFQVFNELNSVAHFSRPVFRFKALLRQETANKAFKTRAGTPAPQFALLGFHAESLRVLVAIIA